MKSIRLMSGFMTVSFWTLASRILGLLREILLNAYIGPGPLMDAFVAAFRLPNMFRRFFAEGAFNAAFVPMFSRRLEADENPNGFASQAFSGLAFSLLILTALGMIFMPALVYGTAEGFYGTDRFDLTVDYGRVMFPYIFLISLSALFSGALNAKGYFAAAAAAPVFLNVIVCGALFLSPYLGSETIHVLVWSIPVAGILQLGIVWVAAQRAGVVIKPQRPVWNDDMRKLVRVAIPAALANGVVQINLVVGQIVSSQYDNAVSWLYSADRLYQLPLGVVGIGIGIVLLPDLSRRLKAGDDAGSKHALSRAAEIAMVLTLPCAAALLIVPMPIVSVLFERGKFGADDTAAVSLALMIYALGLPAFVFQKVQQPLFFARSDTRRPFNYAVVSMIVNAALAIGLAPIFGWLAPAIGTTVAAWIMVVQLRNGALKFGDTARLDAKFRARVWRIVLASAIAGGAMWTLYVALMPAYASAWRYLALTALILGGAASYAIAGQITGAFSLSELKSQFKRNRT